MLLAVCMGAHKQRFNSALLNWPINNGIIQNWHRMADYKKEMKAEKLNITVIKWDSRRKAKLFSCIVPGSDIITVLYIRFY